jgi:hypothetical protein
MAYVHSAALEFPKEKAAIAVSRGAFGSHLGIAFHSAKDGVQVLHLRTHLQLFSETFDASRLCWVASPLDLPPKASAQVVSIIRGLAKRRPHIPYGLNFLKSNGSFDPNGHYKAPKGSNGLTCATFVSTLFSDLRAPLIQPATWQPSDENRAWAEDVCKFLETHGVPEDHVAAVRGNVDGLRVRPEEVAVAAVVAGADLPIDFTRATADAPMVMATLHAACPLRPPVATPTDVAAAESAAAEPDSVGKVGPEVVAKTEPANAAASGPKS